MSLLGQEDVLSVSAGAAAAGNTRFFPFLSSETAAAAAAAAKSGETPQPAGKRGGGDGKLREVGGNSFFPSLYNMPAHCPQSEISILRTMHKFCDKDFFKRNLLYKNSSLGCWITKTIKKIAAFDFRPLNEPPQETREGRFFVVRILYSTTVYDRVVRG